MNAINGKNCFSSWSGGKDSCLALYRAIQSGGIPRALLTILREDGEKSHSHGLPISIFQRQAEAMHIPLFTRNTSWSDYTAVFTSILKDFKEQGITHGIFGDIDIEDHRRWCQEVCNSTGLTEYHPLWQADRQELLDEFLELQFKATIVAVKQDFLEKGWLGKQLTPNLIQEMKIAGIDPCGENGEYHTVVTAAPIFSTEIELTFHETVFHDGYWFLNVL